MTTHHDHGHGLDPDVTAEAFWDGLYRERDLDADPDPNPVLRETAGGLPVGAALDLACGAGGDTLWLARRGWRVTAVDISATAIAHVRAICAAHGVGDRVTLERHDLASSFPAGRFDLISVHYVHSPMGLPRSEVLRRAAHALTPGGVLLVVDHGSIAPWSWNQDHDVHFPTPREVADELALDPAQWRVERADATRREATGPDGEQAEVIDHILLLRRSSPPLID